MQKKFNHWFILSLLFFTGMTSLAQRKQVTNIGTVAKNINEQINVFTNFINAACIILGAAFLFASIIKYFEHRRSPLMVHLSTVFFLFFAGIIFLLIPLIQYLQS
jgi:drug/metabolite transporter (DMT)-like permease